MFVLLTFPVVPNLLSLSTQRCRIDNNVSPLTPTPPPVFTAKGRPWERWTPWPWGIVRCWEWAEPLGPLWKAVTGASQTGSLDHISTFSLLLQTKMKGTLLKRFFLPFCQGLIARVKLLIVFDYIFNTMEKEEKTKSGSWRKFSPRNFISGGLLSIWIWRVG